MFVNSPIRITTFVNACFSLTASVQRMSVVDTYDWHVYIMLGNFDTNLLLFLKGYVDNPFQF